MKKALKITAKIFKLLIIVLLLLIVLFLIVRNIGRAINNRTPENGINEVQYVDVNGQKMWVNIYGENKDNPVLLYLHGGAGYSTSYCDYAILRKLAKDYTICNWDQRNCGKTWLKDPQDTPITLEMMREDIDILTDYLLEYLGKDKITVMGISWGSFYALDFAQNHPEKTDCCIGLSQYVGQYDGCFEYNMSFNFIVMEYLKSINAIPPEFDEEDFRKSLLDPKSDLENNKNVQIMGECIKKNLTQLDKYMTENGYVVDMLDDIDVNIVAAVIFSPYYTLPEMYKAIFSYEKADNGMKIYSDSLMKELDDFELNHTLLDRTVYEMPVYMMLADRDINCDPKVAEEYFNSITAPDKELRYTHGVHESTMYHSEELAAFVHEIAEKQKNSNSAS